MRRRNVTLTIDRLDIIDDSDTDSGGDLKFATAIYDATVPGGARLTEPRYSG